MRQLSVIQVVDSLQIGGMESVAANFANVLAQRGMKSSICCTRRSGPLQARLSDSVKFLNLERVGLVDFKALKRFTRFLQEQGVDVVHAHGTALFFCTLASLLYGGPGLVWHDHFGRYAIEERSRWLYRLATRRVGGIIAVNKPLADWARDALKVPADRIWYVPNFVIEPVNSPQPAILPGTPGKRIVCVANLRPEKDHLTLVEAMRKVAQADRSACLLLVGDHANHAQAENVRERIRQHRLQDRIFLLGSRSDAGAILRQCDIGVLSSSSEGLPLALLEYGVAGLPTVATRVGQVSEVLDSGRSGLLVSPGEPKELAEALLSLLESSDLRREFGASLKHRVRDKYSESRVMEEIGNIYHMVLGT